MNKLYGTASVNGTQETAEGINTNNWPILTYMKNRMHNSGCGKCEMKIAQLITWNTSGKYILSKIAGPSPSPFSEQSTSVGLYSGQRKPVLCPSSN